MKTKVIHVDKELEEKHNKIQKATLLKWEKEQDMKDPIFYAHEMSKGSPNSLYRKSMKHLQTLLEKK